MAGDSPCSTAVFAAQWRPGARRNSPTISVCRSALGKGSAARRASIGSAPTSGAISPASRMMPLHALACVPSLAWKVTPNWFEAGHALVERLFQIQPELFRRPPSACPRVGQVRRLVGFCPANGAASDSTRAHDLAILPWAIQPCRHRSASIVGGDDETIGEAEFTPLPHRRRGR